MGHTHASFDVLEPVLPLRRGLEFVLEGVAAAFFWAIPEVVDPANLTLYDDPLVGLVAALLDLLEAKPLLLSAALYRLSTEAL